MDRKQAYSNSLSFIWHRQQEDESAATVKSPYMHQVKCADDRSDEK